MRLKFASSVISIVVVLITCIALLLADNPRYTHAFVVKGADCGLRVEASPDYVDVNNLNPGDKKSSYLTVHNDGAKELTYFFEIEKTGGKPGEYRGVAGRELAEKLEFTIERNGVLYFEGLVSEFNKEKQKGIKLAAGDQDKLDITVHLPGEETGNEYQGASVTVKFAFWATCNNGGDDDDENGDDGGGGGDSQSLTIRKFNDLNGNGTWDSGEPEIHDWKVFINDREYKTPVTITQTGTYTIREEQRDSWQQTAPEPVGEAVTVTLGKNETITLSFGNFYHGIGGGGSTLTVRKFHDFNQDGVWDEHEPEIVDWVVFINEEEYRTPVVLRDLVGDFVIEEQYQDGWTQTAPLPIGEPVRVSLREGDNKTVAFGNYLPAGTLLVEPPVLTPPTGVPVVPPTGVPTGVPAIPPTSVPVITPRTGEIPPGIFYGIGVLLVLAGGIIGRKYWIKRN